MNKKYVPSIIEMIYEGIEIDVEYNPETVTRDIENLTKEVDDLQKKMDQDNIQFQSGEIEFNVINDDILNYLEKKQQLDYLSLTVRAKTSMATGQEQPQ
jgi:hypothetical protein